MQKIDYSGIDALLVTNLTNIFYCSGFLGSYGKLLLFPSGKKILVSDSRYSAAAKALCDPKKIEYRELSPKKNFWSNIAKENNITLLGIEAEHTSVSELESLKEKFSDQKIIPTKDRVEILRRDKSLQEIFSLKKAAQIGDAALAETVKNFSEGITEKQLAWVFESYARNTLGADSLSFDCIVAFRENSAVPHHSPSDKKLTYNTPILIDCGVKYEGYCSDLTRCFWFGDQKGEKFDTWKKAYQVVYDAQKAGIEKYRVGGKISDADRAARKILGDQEKFFIHSLGHGVGLDIHEYPRISHRVSDDEIFTENMIVTAEPGLYYPGDFGIRIEDLLVVTSDGAEYLSFSPYY